MEQNMDKLDNEIVIRGFTEADLDEALDIMDGNLDSIKGLSEVLPYNREDAAMAVRFFLQDKDYVLLAAEIDGELLGFAFSAIFPSLWCHTIKEGTELALNTNAGADKRLQLKAQMLLLKETEKRCKDKGAKIYRVQALDTYRMGDRFIENGYKVMSHSYYKELT